MQMLASDLARDACIITIDPKGELTDAIRHLRLGSRMILFDPERTPFALNPLDVGQSDLKRALNQVEYIFSAILDAAVTPIQKGLLRSLLRAVITGIPNATLRTVQDLIESGPDKYRDDIARMDDDLQIIFTKTKWKSYEASLTGLEQRLRTLLESDLIRKSFLSPTTRFRMADAMDNGNVVIIDNAESKLYEDGCKFLGRYMITQIWEAATQRARRPPDQKKPVFVYIDEADKVIDKTIAEIIDRCAAQNIALIMAHQRTSQIADPYVLGALENCAIKMANVDAQASYFAKLMRIPEEQLSRLKRGQFAVSIRDQAPGVIYTDPNALRFSKMTQDEQRALERRMIDLYGPEAQSPVSRLKLIDKPPEPTPEPSPKEPPRGKPLW
jgi:hypothetical protein